MAPSSPRSIELLTRTEVRALLNTCGSRSAKGIRDCALIAVLYGSGVRISEALALMPRDIDAERSALTIRCGKGGKRRVVGIDRGNLALLEAWLLRRAKMLEAGVVNARRSPVFCGYRRGHEGQPMTRKNAWRMIRQRAVRAGIEKRVHPHGLRHTHASELSAEKVDLCLISLQLGHADVATTARYVRALRPEAVLEVVAARAM